MRRIIIIALFIGIVSSFQKSMAEITYPTKELVPYSHGLPLDLFPATDTEYIQSYIAKAENDLGLSKSDSRTLEALSTKRVSLLSASKTFFFLISGIVLLIVILYSIKLIKPEVTDVHDFRSLKIFTIKTLHL